jgi:hypothetical protein
MMGQCALQQRHFKTPACQNNGRSIAVPHSPKHLSGNGAARQKLILAEAILASKKQPSIEQIFLQHKYPCHQLPGGAMNCIPKLWQQAFFAGGFFPSFTCMHIRSNPAMVSFTD